MKQEQNTEITNQTLFDEEEIKPTPKHYDYEDLKEKQIMKKAKIRSKKQ